MSLRFLLAAMAFLALIACVEDGIQVDQYDIQISILPDGADAFAVRLDTDISPEFDDTIMFTISAFRKYRVGGDSADKHHWVYGGQDIPLGDLRDGITAVAWIDRDFAVGHRPSKLADASIKREIYRRARISNMAGRPWTTIEVLPEFCVSVAPDTELPDELTGAAVFTHTNQITGEKSTRISQSHIRECVQYGEYQKLR